MPFNFLYSFVSTFLTSYFLYWIISLFNFKNPKKISIIVISLTTLPGIVYYLLQVIELFKLGNTEVALISLGNILAPIIAYVAIIIYLLDGKKLFKTKRQREYERQVKNLDEKPNYIAISILLILGVISLIYAIILSINTSMDNAIALVGAYGVAIIFISVPIYILVGKGAIEQIKEEKVITKVLSGNLIFILDLNSKRYVYSAPLNNEPIDKLLGEINTTYILTNFGELITPTDIYSVRGIKVDRIEEKYIRGINMPLNKDEKLLEVLNSFERYKTKQIIIDENYNITKEISK